MRRAQLFPVILRVLDEADVIAARQGDAQPSLSREELLRATHQADTGHASEVLDQAVDTCLAAATAASSERPDPKVEGAEFSFGWNRPQSEQQQAFRQPANTRSWVESRFFVGALRAATLVMGIVMLVISGIAGLALAVKVIESFGLTDSRLLSYLVTAGCGVALIGGTGGAWVALATRLDQWTSRISPARRSRWLEGDLGIEGETS